MADKRIRDLISQTDPFLSDFLPIDRPGWSEANKISLQKIIDLAAISAPFSKSYSGETNPDNAFGSNGDSFFVVPEDQTGLKLFQKIDDEWALIFELTFAASGTGGTPTSGTLLSSDSPLVITWDTDLVPDDSQGRTYLQKHGPLEKVSIQVTMPDPANDGDNTFFPSWRFDEATKNILTIDNQGQKLYYVIGFGADGNSSGGGITLTTEGTSGAATLEGSVLNIPVYTDGGGGLELGETSTTAYRGDRGKTAYDHSQSTGNPHGTTIADIAGLQTELDNKVEQDGSKVLSDNNYDNTDKAKVDATSGTNTGDQDLSNLVVKETGKGLSKNDYTDTDKAKVDATSGTNTGDNSPNTNSNAYADAKVQDSLTASTTIAPSATAVNGALSGKEPSITAGTSAQFWLGNKTWGDILTTVLGVVLTGLSTATSTAVVAADTILVAIGKLQAQLNLKANIAPTVGTSTALTFASENIQGSVGTPLTGNITGVTTGAVVGVVVHVVHNSGSAPTFDSKFKKSSGSGNYVTGSINHIYCEYMSSTYILYTIAQAT